MQHACLRVGWLQEVSVQSAGAHSSDLAILAVAARQLFESTREMATDAVVSILVSLRVVSARTLPQAAQQPGAPKCGMHRSACKSCMWHHSQSQRAVVSAGHVASRS